MGWELLLLSEVSAALNAKPMRFSYLLSSSLEMDSIEMILSLEQPLEFRGAQSTILMRSPLIISIRSAAENRRCHIDGRGIGLTSKF
jgi:hypothetical protein